MTQPNLITIKSPKLTAGINYHGAELTSLRDKTGKELMTDADPAFWTGHAPILFPIVGALSGNTLRVDGNTYKMDKHGFARRSDFEVIEHQAHHVILRLTDSEATRKSYPFAFALDLKYALEGATLTLTAKIANRGDVPLPASFGFHPAFAWPLPYGEPREKHRILFGKQEPGELKTIAADGTIAPETCESPLDGRTLRLRDDLFVEDALIWDPVASQAVTYGAFGAPTLDIAFPDTPKLGIWTKPGAAFVCVEPWHGIADPHGYTGEFRDKPGVFKVPVGGEKVITMSVTLTA
ncbi:aldose 1-epimerase family protein [Sphingomonas sp. GB1N7]|uniref:aldose 1-epimerase family protein n=1 Tax=Parasphingomonas caseinilytica TaxID=3096158 RepID=UPI002FCBFBBC